MEWGVLDREAIELNLRFVVSKLLARPEVTLKWAMSLDGKIATAAGESRWISSPAGRRWALGLREEHDALLVGSGTVLADDPSLDRRLGWAKATNTRVVLDRRLRIGPGAVLFEVAGAGARLHRVGRRGATPGVGRARRRGGRARGGRRRAPCSTICTAAVSRACWSRAAARCSAPFSPTISSIASRCAARRS